MNCVAFKQGKFTWSLHQVEGCSWPMWMVEDTTTGNWCASPNKWECEKWVEANS
jgi:hypothetical protein